MGAYDTTVGVLLLGLFFNTFLYGIVCVQFLTYKNHKFNDALWIKAIVAALFVVDTVHSAVSIYAGWQMAVTNFDNPSSLAIVSWTIPFTAVATAFAAILTQAFMSHRVYKLTASKPAVIVIGIFSAVGFVFGTYAGIRSGIIAEVKNFGVLKPFVICWLGSQTVADLLLTCILIYAFARSKTGFRKTDSVINRLIRGSIQTGLFVSIFALGDLFTFTLHGNTNLYAMFAYPIGRIYTNTLLDTLNSRIALKTIAYTETEEKSGAAPGDFRMHTQSQTYAENNKSDGKFNVETASQV
ncbi:hypothetical protein D9619_002579 [Psilocybe cf. subviscida]|uniref:DUF6534 domain-containing protein n=1 Tax=Psilocybe cf. subviscida TaxID=2480587 RepID=A0A8H5AYG5_9AGAR|nr:hypothetical protein D9619_002579 [Psilocybe cf. subviscida]